MDRCHALSQAVKQAHKDPAIQGLILTSACPQVFSAGLDLTEMHLKMHLDEDADSNKQEDLRLRRLHDFWSAFQQVYLDLYCSRLACIAAISGHAPAAGCMLALCCDVRIMVAGDDSKPNKMPTIGLNESKLGIVAPPWLGQMFVDTVGRRQGELGLGLGLLYPPDTALDIGLIDEVVSANELTVRAAEEAAQWIQIPPTARVAAKMLIRKDRINRLIQNRRADKDNFCNFVQTAPVQLQLTAYLEKLAAKKKK